MNVNQSAKSKSQTFIQAQAKQWWVRVNSGAMDAMEQAHFQTWLNANPKHQAAFEEINHLWQELDGVKDILAEMIAAPPVKPHWYERWQVHVPAVAACLLMVVFFNTASIKLRADASTDVAETRTIQLADGSIVEMNSETALSIHLTPKSRELTLLRGEALFKVSPDPSRPFQVRAGAGVITALGTVFNVRQNQGISEVTVTEHTVAVNLDGNTLDSPDQAVLAEGQQMAYDADKGLGAVNTVDTQIATAWLRGKLVFQDKPLGEVIAELNHYHHGYFLITDPGIAQHKVNGVFNTDNPIAALNAIEKFQNLHSNRLSHYLVLLHR